MHPQVAKIDRVSGHIAQMYVVHLCFKTERIIQRTQTSWALLAAVTPADASSIPSPATPVHIVQG
jgi:hypothetical protein